MRLANEVIGYCGLTYLDDVRRRGEIELGYRLNASSIRVLEKFGMSYICDFMRESHIRPDRSAVREAALTSLAAVRTRPQSK